MKPSAKLTSATLFLATCATTIYAGLQLSERRSELIEQGTAWMSDPTVWAQGLSFTVGLLGILIAHELGHYLAARRLGMRPPPPIFLPGPPPFGTLGAIIAVPDEPLPASSHLRIAAAGPIAGMLVAAPLALIGIWMSELRTVEELGDDVMYLGTPLLFKAMEWLKFGAIEAGTEVYLHPLAFAAWAGFFVTALNLIPLGPLDGGRIAWATFSTRWRWPERVVAAGLILLGVFAYLGWVIIAGLVLLFLGLGQPWSDAQEQKRELGLVDLCLACTCGIIFLLTFLPVPFKLG